MLKKLFYGAIFSCSIIMIGCNSNEIYNEHTETGEGFEWKASDKKTFEVAVEDPSVKYNVYVTFRYATGFAKSLAPVKLSHTNPSGETTANEVKLKIRDENGDYLGEPGYDIWDSKHLIEAETQLEKGKHNYVLQTDNGPNNLFPVLDVGIIVEKVAAN